VFLLLYLKFNKSFPIIFIITPIGVTIKKKITPITKGETIVPNNIPNLNQILFNGVRIFEFLRPNTKNMRDKNKDQNLKSFEFNNGYIAIKKNTKKNIIPKLLLELLFLS
tara:strand:+ start:2083 stop:2412 length:330 start_codon:yes stop_codon:yes gene_type:complete